LPLPHFFLYFCVLKLYYLKNKHLFLSIKYYIFITENMEPKIKSRNFNFSGGRDGRITVKASPGKGSEAIPEKQAGCAGALL
jgi:hypothetical protein